MTTTPYITIEFTATATGWRGQLRRQGVVTETSEGSGAAALLRRLVQWLDSLRENPVVMICGRPLSVGRPYKMRAAIQVLLERLDASDEPCTGHGDESSR